MKNHLFYTLRQFVVNKLIQRGDSGQWHITNLGAILFAKRLKDFGALTRKAVRLIAYKGNNKLVTNRELEGAKGYAVGFEGLIDYLKTLLPSNEEIGKAFRTEVPMYPELALRELVANAIIHQDFTLTGKSEQAEEDVMDVQDKILQAMQSRKMRGNASYLAFTATPKNTTLEKFGVKQADGSFEPFHLYSMKQAIEEGFILDVLANYTRQHLDSKAIKLAVLGKQIDWLETYQPADEKIPPRLRLLWLTARLANANHLGETEKDWMIEMQALSTQLMDEDSPLVCWADLHLAVNATNRYDFSQASQCLSRWLEVPRSVPGLRYWGQAASSLGQHAAFNNQPEKARTFFDAALGAFARLTDEEQRRRDTTQTATYRAILEIDHGDETSAREAVYTDFVQQFNDVFKY